MTNGYNTSVNQTKNNAYSYNPNNPPNVTLSGGVSKFNYSEVYSGNGETSANTTKNNPTKSSATGVWGITMGQTQNFTFSITGLCEADNSFYLANRNGKFLPLKQMEYKPVSLEHLKIKAGVFSDLPFFHRRKLGTISCTMLDSSKSLLSQRLFQWFNSCVYTSGYVPYVDEMCRDATYIEYTHDGKIATKYVFAVMPDGDVSVSRTYEGDGALTEYRFQLLIVSNIKVGVEGGRWIEADWGYGYGEDADYERRVSAKIFTDQFTMTYNDPAIADYTGKR